MMKIDIHTYTQYVYSVYELYTHTHIQRERCKIIQKAKVASYLSSASKMIIYHDNIKIINKNEMRKIKLNKVKDKQNGHKKEHSS